MTFTILALIGALQAAAIAWIAHTWLRRLERVIYAAILIATALTYVVWAMMRDVERVGLESIGLAIFAVAGVVGVRRAPTLAAAWAAHAVWDLGLHGPHTAHVPWWFPPYCVGFDLLLAAAIWWGARAQGSPAIARR